MKTLQSSLAGSWYPATETAIRRMAEEWEREAAADASAHAAPIPPLAPVIKTVLIVPSRSTVWQ